MSKGINKGIKICGRTSTIFRLSDEEILFAYNAAYQEIMIQNLCIKCSKVSLRMTNSSQKPAIKFGNISILYEEEMIYVDQR